MSARPCYGPRQDCTTGHPYCPEFPGDEPEDGDWEHWCADCLAYRGRYEELSGDCDRDEE